MSSVLKIMEIINGVDSPIEIMSNESFSIPFISECEGKMCLTLFSYSVKFRFGETNEKAMVNTVYYVNPNNIFEYVVKDAENIQLIDERIALFSRNNAELKRMSVVNKYHRLVELTDEIISNSGELKKIVSEYADIFSNIVNKELKPYYLTLGYDYFLWLNSLI